MLPSTAALCCTVAAMLASAASAVPVVGTVAKVADKMDDLENTVRSLRSALGVHGEGERKYYYSKVERGSPLVYDRTNSRTHQAPSILAVGPLNTAKSGLLGTLLGEMGCDPSGHEFDVHQHHTPLTGPYVQCVTCFLRGVAQVNLCGMPALFDSEFEDEFWKHFVAAVNLVVENVGPVSSVVYVDTFHGHDVDPFRNLVGHTFRLSSCTDDDVKRGIYRARFINMLLTDAGYDGVLEVAVECLDPLERLRAPERLSKIQRFNSDVSVRAVDPITNLAHRLMFVGDWNYKGLVDKAQTIRLSNVVVDACRAQLGLLQDNRPVSRLSDKTGARGCPCPTHGLQTAVTTSRADGIPTAPGIVVVAWALLAAGALKGLARLRAPVPAPASNGALRKIGITAGVAAAAGGLIAIGVNAAKAKSKEIASGKYEDQEPSAGLQVLSSVAMTVACVLAVDMA
ncbi:unnamed protein product (mitochondrion) [Plasmodiophora brassicae]|uniref:G domain-containing protein n=1 Tax=Plasmodiophora brassicae TaxID=37360 RepID=A0A3P3YHW9_PLABS|nr:unnamed protein product [Plasmodiophora brassicae]